MAGRVCAHSGAPGRQARQAGIPALGDSVKAHRSAHLSTGFPWAFELGPRGLRVNGIAPGATLTHALKSVLTEDIERQMLAHTPLQRLGDPQDMANAALFLYSPAAARISGQILTVSGGGVHELG